MIVLLGQSGSGKDTALQVFLENGFDVVVTDTTRDIRKGEKDGVEHFYITDEEYESKKASNCYVATTVYRGKKYGTDAKYIKDNSIVILDVKGVRDAFGILGEKNVVVVHIKADEEVRENRLIARGDRPELIATSITGDREHFAEAEVICDYIIVNNGDDQEEFKGRVRSFINEILKPHLLKM